MDVEKLLMTERFGHYTSARRSGYPVVLAMVGFVTESMPVSATRLIEASSPRPAIRTTA
jgi:hypothetical protein